MMNRRNFLRGLLALPVALKLAPVIEKIAPSVLRYKGSAPMDAGLYYCPFVPLQGFEIEKISIVAKSRTIPFAVWNLDNSHDGHSIRIGHAPGQYSDSVGHSEHRNDGDPGV